MKKLNVMTSVLLAAACGFSYAGSTAMAVMGEPSSADAVLPISLNNQANVTISTDSVLVPQPAQTVNKQDAVFFNLPAPQEVGTLRIRYANGSSGCDFYLDTRASGSFNLLTTYITAVPISQDSMCNVYTSGNVNHLAVAFTQMR